MLDILIVEDNPGMRMGMSEALQRDGFVVHAFENGQEALDFFKKHPCALAITDLKMEPVDGMQVLESVRAHQPRTAVLVVTAFGTVETAVRAMKEGASDFLAKPFSPDELRFRVANIAERLRQEDQVERLREENERLREDLAGMGELVLGTSDVMRNILSLVDRVAPQDSTVLIEGESGTGKELIARALHQKSPRCNRAFIRVNCGALHDGLLESELFGHEKGAFTGAIRRKKGRFELADGGTLFLDEIGDISPAMQVKLLRVLQEREFERVGGEDTLRVDVRIIAATHRSLDKMVTQNLFREDLYYRLRVIPVRVPPLRERREDIPPLITYFLDDFSRTRRESLRTIDAASMELLTSYSWPGNVRELKHLIERLCVMSPDPIIPYPLVAQQVSGSAAPSGWDHLPLEAAVEAFEKQMILQAMKKCDQTKNRAAKLLGIKTSTLYYKLEKYGLL